MMFLLEHNKSYNNNRHRQNSLITLLVNISTISVLSILPSNILVLDWLLLWFCFTFLYILKLHRIHISHFLSLLLSSFSLQFLLLSAPAPNPKEIQCHSSQRAHPLVLCLNRHACNLNNTCLGFICWFHYLVPFTVWRIKRMQLKTIWAIILLRCSAVLRLLHWGILKCHLLWFEERLMDLEGLFFSLLRILSHLIFVFHIFVSGLQHNLVVSGSSILAGGLFSWAKSR